MCEVKFSDGIPERQERSMNRRIFIYPEELIDKKCRECVRFEARDRGEKGYHCTMRPWEIDIHAEDKACVDYWDRADHEECIRLREEDQEKRRVELWAVYAEKEPIKLPIVNDGYGMIPMCPICGEMPYSTEQCHWCGQRYIQDDEIQEYNRPDVEKYTCKRCGKVGKVIRSKYNGHRSFRCDGCGAGFME